MTLAVSLPITGMPLRETVSLVQDATDWGYTSAWSSEVAGPDFASLLGAVATGADIDLGVAVAPAQTRSPWLLAATASTLSHLSGGRFSLGVGTSSEMIVEQWSGLDFDRPLARLRETVEVLRQLMTGERVSYNGDFVRCNGYKLFAAPPAPVPLLLAALNPKSLRQAGELGDGVCLNQLAPEHMPMVLDEIRKGAEPAGHDLEGFEVMARLFSWVTDDPAAARTSLRRTFAPYTAVSGYNRFFSWLGFEEEMAAVRTAAAEGDREAMRAALSDAFLDTVCAVGDADTVAARIAAHREAGVTVAAIACPAPDAEEARRTLRAVGERLA